MRAVDLRSALEDDGARVSPDPVSQVRPSTPNDRGWEVVGVFKDEGTIRLHAGERDRASRRCSSSSAAGRSTRSSRGTMID